MIWEGLRAVIGAIVVLVLPGLVWSRVAAPEGDWLLRAAIAVPLSIAVLVPVAFTWALIGIPFTHGLALIPVGLVTGAGWLVARMRTDHVGE